MNPIHLVPTFNKESTMHTFQMTATGVSLSLLLITGASAADKTKVKGAVEQAGKAWPSELNNLYVSGLIARALRECDPAFAATEAA